MSAIHRSVQPWSTFLGLVISVFLSGCATDSSENGTDVLAQVQGTAPDAAIPPSPSASTGQGGTSVTGPVTGGKLGVPFNAMPAGMAERAGYVEEEFFIAGAATSFSSPEALSSDGKWSLQPAGAAPYKTRILVRRPADAARFSGTVVVEWFNVSSGMDIDPDFGWLYPEIFRAGHAYVGVSAQRAGVSGGGALSLIPLLPVLALKGWDAQRYGTLDIPGDQYSYDIFTQVGQALKTPAGVDVLAGLRPQRLIAVGESQSSGRLLSYVNGVHPLARTYDAFLIHSRGAGGPGFDPAAAPMGRRAVQVRSDLTDPVLQFETETDLLGLGFAQARQPDNGLLRTWEVAGTAHVDLFALEYGAGSFKRTWPEISANPSDLCPNVNQGPMQWVLRRALRDLEKWIVTKAPPASAPPITVQGTALVRDVHGNVTGGVRTPAVDVPSARYSGVDNPAFLNPLCSLFGSTAPLSAAKLRALYRDSADYISKVDQSIDATIAAGFLLEEDKAELIARARSVNIPAP